MRRKQSEALRIINCLRALARVFIIQQNEADVPEMLTEPGKWLDDDTLLFRGTSKTRHEVELLVKLPDHRSGLAGSVPVGTRHRFRLNRGPLPGQRLRTKLSR